MNLTSAKRYIESQPSLTQKEKDDYLKKAEDAAKGGDEDVQRVCDEVRRKCGGSIGTRMTKRPPQMPGTK